MKIRLANTSLSGISPVDHWDCGDARKDLDELPEPTIYVPISSGVLNFAALGVRPNGDPLKLAFPPSAKSLVLVRIWLHIGCSHNGSVNL
jgi:hypothetical protein